MSVDNTSSKRCRPSDFESEGNISADVGDAVGQKTPLKRQRTGPEVSSTSAEDSSTITDQALGEAEKEKAGAEKAEEDAIKERYKQIWNEWLAHNEWNPEHDRYYRQKIEWEVVQPSDAKTFYRFTDAEMDTLPYAMNRCNPRRPGKAYNRLDLIRLAYRKEAALNGVKGAVHGMPRDKMFKEGKRLFEARMKDLESKYWTFTGGKRRPNLRTFTAVQHPADRDTSEPTRPIGTWWERVWKNGQTVGWWLVCHFDPKAEGSGRDDDFASRERFWPIEKGLPAW